MTICPYCEEGIEHGQAVRYEVTGWERERAQGGTNALELRERTGRIAHALCVSRAKLAPPEQQELFG